MKQAILIMLLFCGNILFSQDVVKNGPVKVVQLEIDENNDEEIINTWMIEHLNLSQNEDFFISKYYVYNNCTDEYANNYYIKDFIGKYIGKIKRTGKQKIWKIGDATILQENTKIYKWKQQMFLTIAVENDNYYVYTPMFETYNKLVQ
jgi:hypothetical protein